MQFPRPLEKRAATYALVNTVGNFAQIYSPYLYNKSTGPRYLPAMGANIAFVFVSICFATTLWFCLKRENRKLDTAEAQNMNDVGNPKGGDEIIQAGPGGILALNSGFRYIL